MELSVVVLTKDSEKHISDCLNTVKWAKEILVIDCGSSDSTVEIAQSSGAKVIYNPWPGFAAQRNFALGLCAYDWVLMVDVDERISTELAQAIKTVLIQTNTEDIVGYSIPRKNFFWDRWMRGTYPDRHFNLFRKSKARFKELAVHESVELNGKTAMLDTPLLHYIYEDLAHYVDKMNWYSSLGASEKGKHGKKFRLRYLFINPIFAFIKIYIFRGGFRDGVPGLVFSVTYSFYVFMKYAKLYPGEKT